MVANQGYFPNMTFGERVRMLTHMHFEPQRIAQARGKIQKKIEDGIKPERHDDYRTRLAEYDTRLAEIQKVWIAAPDAERIAAHEQIAQHDHTGRRL